MSNPTPLPRITATEYEVSLLPPDFEDGWYFSVQVAYRGRGLYAVLHHGLCLGTDGEWDYESLPSSREDDWLETHRFPLQEALDLARDWAPKVGIYSHREKRFITAADVWREDPGIQAEFRRNRERVSKGVLR